MLAQKANKMDRTYIKTHSFDFLSLMQVSLLHKIARISKAFSTVRYTWDCCPLYLSLAGGLVSLGCLGVTTITEDGLSD